MYLEIFFVFLCLALLCTLTATGGDILAPCNVFVMTYIVACTFALYADNKWNLHIHQKTFFILILGTVIFLFASLPYIPQNAEAYFYILNVIEINHRKIILLLSWSIFIIVSTYVCIWRLCSVDVPIQNVFVVFSRYRIYTVLHPEYGLPAFISYGSKISEVGSYILIFAYINNVAISKHNTVKYLNYLLLPMLEIVHAMESGARLGILNIIAAFVTCGYIYIYRDKSINMRLRLILRYAFFAVAFLYVFYKLAVVLDRAGNGTIIDYISIYLGTPIKLLDIFVEQRSFNREVFGQETFYPLIRMLHKFGIVKKVPVGYMIHLPFEYVGNLNLGNVYTAYRRWYNDFGLSGIIIFQSMFSLFFNSVYKRIIDRPEKRGKIVVFYIYYVFPLYLHFFDDKLFRNVFCSAFVINCVLIQLLFRFLIEERSESYIAELM